MQSSIANLFLALQATIANLQDGAGNTYFKYIDQDLGQLDVEQPKVLWPCVLIDIDNLIYTSMSSNTQQGQGHIRLRLGFPAFSASGASTPDAYKQKSIYFYELEQILHQALQGQTPDDNVFENIGDGELPEPLLANTFGAFNRISAATEKGRPDFIRVRQITYTIAYDDYSTQPTQTLASTPALNLTPEIL